MSSSSACSSDSGGSSPRSSLAGVYTPLAEPVDVARFTPVRPAEYPPDKEATWTLPPELMSFVLMHNALRAEVTKFESLLFKLGSRPLEEWEVDAVKVRRRPRHPPRKTWERRTRRLPAPFAFPFFSLACLIISCLGVPNRERFHPSHIIRRG